MSVSDDARAFLVHETAKRQVRTPLTAAQLLRPIDRPCATIGCENQVKVPHVCIVIPVFCTHCVKARDDRKPRRFKA